MAETKRALITGITGQDGSYLAELLLEKGYEVHGMVRRSSSENFQRLNPIRDRITLHPGDLLDQRSLIAVLRDSSPHEIYNLAAMSFVAASWNQPTLTAEFTGVGVARLLEAMREVCPEARFYQASSSEMFGKVLEVPQNERPRSIPRSPYGVAKAFGHFITVNYRESYGLFACSGILFNHESPRRGLEFVTRKVTHGVAAIKLGLADELALGQPRRQARLGLRPGVRRGDVADAAAGRARDYVIGTGENHSVEELVDIAFDHVGLDRERHVKLDPAFLRPAEVDDLIADSSQGARGARLGAGDRLRGPGPADGRRRPRAAPNRGTCRLRVAPPA